MTVFWVCFGWLAAAITVGVVLGRAIAFANDGRLARERAGRISSRVHGALVPSPASSELRLVIRRPSTSLDSRHLSGMAALLLLGACALPTSDEPRVTSTSGDAATVEYSGERAAEADQKAREACAQHGKRPGRASTRSGATGGSIRNYDCAE